MLNRKFNCIRCELPSVHVTSKHLSENIKQKELLHCGSPKNSKETEALHYSDTTFWVRTPPVLGWQTRNLFIIQQK